MVFTTCEYTYFTQPRQTPLLSQNPLSQAVQSPTTSLAQVTQLLLSSHPESQQSIVQSAGCYICDNTDFNDR